MYYKKSLYICQSKTITAKTIIMKNFTNINTIVNANATEMVDNTKWISWFLDLNRKGHSQKNLEKIARLITQ